MSYVCLGNKIFFTPSVSVGPKPTIRDLETLAAGCSSNDVYVTSSDDKSDYGNLDDGQFDTSFLSVGELLHERVNHRVV